MKKRENRQMLGCVADDFTGASDAASFLQKAGMHTLLINEIPEHLTIPEQTDAIVVALKSRTQKTEAAVADTLNAIRWLERAGAEKFYFKYCSTFDSTPEGNIGPVADAIMEYLDQPYTILCPALPVNERIVRDGRLFVKGVPLDESPMRNHPLTPMWDSRIKNLIAPQSRYPAFELTQPQLQLAQKEADMLLPEWSGADRHFYVIPDYTNDEDGEKIVRLFGHLKFLTGGSGILEHLAAYIMKGKDSSAKGASERQQGNPSPGVVFAGSCSVATLGQIADFQSRGKKSYKLDPLAVCEGRQTAEDVVRFVLQYPDEEVLVYSSDQAEKVKEVQKLGREKIAALLETVISTAAAMLVERGYGRIVVAGGETSGAVTKALGYSSFTIGASVAPGVPMMTPVDNGAVTLVLKSGNFGQPDFFIRALAMTKGEKNE